MSFSINTNIASMQAQYYLTKTSSFQSATINQVTSGLRIVNSGDDAAGLAVANGYQASEAVLNQGILNANDGLSQLQIADGGISNITQLLDRASTLATQSASGTFTGDRTVLNNEFQGVIAQINQQAQQIGLNQGGSFAKNLSVFIGGGQQSNGISATQNGTVSLDLSNSSVDAAGLGLQGVQAGGAAGTDIGTGSVNTSLAQILGNTTNSSSVANAGFTQFILRGPGFAGNGVAINVNTANIGGTADLVTAVNSAIQGAENTGTQAGTALKNAGITASVNTDSTGKQQLKFTSSTTAFQVQAGDREANALLGNFQQNAAATSTDNNATVDTSSNSTLTIAIDGGATHTFSVPSAAGTSKGQIVNALNANSTFSAEAVASLKGNQVVIQSKTNAANSSVSVTGNLATALGFGATATAGAASTGAALSTQVSGATAVDGNANVIGTDSNATNSIVTGTSDTLTLTVGSSGSQSLTLTGGTNLTKADIAADINTQIANNGNFTGANQVTASVVNNQIVLEAGTPGTSIAIGAGDANAALGFTSNTTSTTHTSTTSDNITLQFQGGGLTSPVAVSLNPTTAGTTTTANILADLQTKIAGNTSLAAAGITLSTSSSGNNLVFTSATGQQFQVLASGDSNNVLGLGSFKTGANSAVDYTSITAGSAYSQSAPSGTANFQVSLDGGASSGNAFSANLAAGDATAALQAGTAVLTGNSSGAATAAAVGGSVNFLTSSPFNLSTSSGAAAKIVVAVDGTNYNVTLGNGNAVTGNTILGDFNTALSGHATATLDSSGNLKITNNSTGSAHSVQIVASGSDNVLLTAVGLTAGAAVTGTDVTGANDFSAAASNASAIKVRVDGGAVQTITLGNGSNVSASTILSDFSSLTGATASLDGTGKLHLTSNTKGSNSSVEIVGGVGGSDAALVTALGLTTGTTNGQNASIGNVVQQLNASIASNSTLVAAGIQASNNGGSIQIQSSNGTYFQLNAYGNGNAGFGTTGASFAGNTQGAAPTSSQYFNSGGADATTALAYSNIQFGTDAQTVNLTASDANGVKHSLSVELQNDPSGRQQSIDQAISSINTQLQQSNDSTLNQIVAVKGDSGGAQTIQFLSTVKGFQVTVGSTPNSTGITPPTGNTITATTVGQGSNVSIADSSSAATAVTALASAVTALGRAQAVVGRGENQFNYAINLAQSQVTNFSAAESRIRDANLAAESANLTKAQIQMQAGVAALAQANSAPQQILSLLQGH